VPDGALAVFAGRFTPEKRLETVLSAWPAVHASTGASLVLMGHGPIEEALRARHGHPGIVWHPFETDRSRVADVLAAADLYVAPGPAETFGLAALEALASGTPILSVDRGGAAELARKSGAGRCYQLGDVLDCAAQAVALIQAAPLRAEARHCAEARYAWPVVLADLFAQYRAVIEPEARVTT
jgi:alpha-1,6-mannosyltransferase